jgi:hypothetical protein
VICAVLIKALNMYMLCFSTVGSHVLSAKVSSIPCDSVFSRSLQNISF